MKFQHSQKGITAVSMIIIIVILLLLASFSLFSSRDLVVESNLAKAYNEILMMKNAVRNVSLNDYYKDTIITSRKVKDIGEYNSRVGNKMTTDKTYYYFGYRDSTVPDSVKQELNEVLDLRSVSNSYIVCINGEGDVEVMLVDGVRYGDAQYFTYDEIANVYANVTKN